VDGGGEDQRAPGPRRVGGRLQVLFPNFSPFFQIPMKLSVWHVRRWIRDLGNVPLAGDRVDQGQVLIDLSIVKPRKRIGSNVPLVLEGLPGS
jgi:hypothetical protein